ncbi:hypothetical protein GCM10025875_29400 [Litorihabitans aurantiacus]|uniref:DNA helicase n=1 Tax=Litorihabitans aurantiacus TaxID=1930061 RepID=A0AA38CRP1_9MICO|nr:hypothetical protein GCM10025875_29400 [Litorihabitans aurantiacus]
MRAPSPGALVVDGGPGTGKTVVALHRAAYLLHAEPGVDAGRGGVLVVGPHQPYLDFVADVLPALGEDGVRTCTLRDLLPQGRAPPSSAIRAWPPSRRVPRSWRRSSRPSPCTRSRRRARSTSRRRGPTSG